MKSNVIPMQYTLKYLDKEELHFNYYAAHRRFMALKGDGPCRFHVTISYRNRVIFESIPMIIDGEEVF